MGDTLVVGAGSSGLAAAKNLLGAGFDVDVVERERDLGGNWNFSGTGSRVYSGTHTISSKPFTQYPDFPMADADPDYPHHTEIHAYLRRYADHFGVTPRVRTSTSVESCVPRDGGGWRVELAQVGEDGSVGGDVEVREYERLVVANGHNRDPKVPTYPGQDTFHGRIIHTAEFKRPEQLDGRRVLVVGAGNSGCDVAVAAVGRAEAVWHSTRRAYWYAPKYALGRPADQLGDLVFSLGLPIRWTQAILEATARVVVGRYERYGLPTPDHRFLETHPIVNQTLLYHVGHGDITPVPDIARFDGDAVELTDGRRLDVDLVVFATGYTITVPFLDPALLNWRDGAPRLYRNVLHPERTDLAVIGLIQPDSGQFGLVHWQSVLLARFLTLVRVDPPAARAELARFARSVDERSQGGVELVDSTRHLVEVEHLDYARALDRDLARLNALIAAAMPSARAASLAGRA
jgi:thioredoxin reductase